MPAAERSIVDRMASGISLRLPLETCFPGLRANGPSNRAWKYRLYQHLTKRHALTVTVAHYPPGASKWNPIEHRLFSEVSKNWAGHPLDSYETILNYIRTTSTKTGLRVQAHLVDRHYDKGVKLTDTQMRAVPINQHHSFPKWNYTIASVGPI